jgi:hypothetical protein
MNMRLTKTNGGNWAKQAEIGAGYDAIGFHRTRAEAELAAQPGQHVVPVRLGDKLVRRLYGDAATLEWRPCEAGNQLAVVIDGQVVEAPRDRVEIGCGVMDTVLAAYMVGRPRRGRVVMQHASAAECLAAGKTPGRCNF